MQEEEGEDNEGEEEEEKEELEEKVEELRLRKVEFSEPMSCPNGQLIIWLWSSVRGLHWEIKMWVSSAYRSPRVDQLAKGSQTTQMEKGNGEREKTRG